MRIAKVVRELAIKHQLNVRKTEDGHYWIVDPNTGETIRRSILPTAASGAHMVRYYAKHPNEPRFA